MIAIAFWISLFLLVYPLFLYPPLLELLVRLLGRTKGLCGEEANAVENFQRNLELPAVSILLSVYNEKEIITEKIDNFLALKYPQERLELVVVSDGSDDGTDELISMHTALRICEDRVKLVRQTTRQGKSVALNAAALVAHGEILLFTDADSMLAPESLSLLVKPFACPQVDLVSGRSIYVDASGRENEGSLYRRFEEWLKQREGRLYGISGADGALYAMRASAYNPLEPEYINDLLHPVQVALSGKLSIAVPEANVIERDLSRSSGDEFARQTRIMAQSWLIFLRYTGTVLRQKRFGFFWQIVSHKVLRWLTLPLLGVNAIAAIWTPGKTPLFCLIGIGVFFLLTFFGSRLQGGRFPRVAWYFSLQSAAAMNGLFQLWQGERYVTWKPRGN